MPKCKKFNSGAMVAEDFESEYSKPKAKKPLPADNLKQDKPVVQKYVVEPFRKANDKVSNTLESVGLTNPVDVIDETFGGETVAEAKESILHAIKLLKELNEANLPKELKEEFELLFDTHI